MKLARIPPRQAYAICFELRSANHWRAKCAGTLFRGRGDGGILPGRGGNARGGWSENLIR
jgi:hypothetical protein